MAIPNPTSAVNPSAASIDALAAVADENPIIMLNLLRFAPDGEAFYNAYGAVAGGTVRARGGSNPYIGDSVDRSGGWDKVLLVRYPRRAAYLDMQSDPAYVGAIPDRTRGLSARLLHPFHLPNGDPEEPFTFPQLDREHDRIVVTLVRFHDPSRSDDWQPYGDVLLRLVADSPMVSDDDWDEMIVTRHRDGEIRPIDAPEIAGRMEIITRPVFWQ